MSDRVTDRVQQIIATAIRVRPTDVGTWARATGHSVADGVIISPADLAWLVNQAFQRLENEEES